MWVSDRCWLAHFPTSWALLFASLHSTHFKSTCEKSSLKSLQEDVEMKCRAEIPLATFKYSRLGPKAELHPWIPLAKQQSSAHIRQMRE